MSAVKCCALNLALPIQERHKMELINIPTHIGEGIMEKYQLKAPRPSFHHKGDLFVPGGQMAVNKKLRQETENEGEGEGNKGREEEHQASLGHH